MWYQTSDYFPNLSFNKSDVQNRMKVFSKDNLAFLVEKDWFHDAGGWNVGVDDHERSLFSDGIPACGRMCSGFTPEKG